MTSGEIKISTVKWDWDVLITRYKELDHKGIICEKRGENNCTRRIMKAELYRLQSSGRQKRSIDTVQKDIK